MSFRSIIGKTFRHPISKLIFHSGKKAQLTMYPVYSSRFMSRPRPTEFPARGKRRAARHAQQGALRICA